MTIDFRAEGMHQGKKGFERVRWCFENTLRRGFEMMLAFVGEDLEQEIVFPMRGEHPIPLKHQVVPLTKTIVDIHVPDLSSSVVRRDPPDGIVDTADIASGSGGAARMKGKSVYEKESKERMECWREEVLEMYEWVGLVSIGSPRYVSLIIISPAQS